MRWTLLLFLPVLGACDKPGMKSAEATGLAAVTRSGPSPRSAIPDDCSLRIDFASYGAGIDREAKEAVEQLLRNDPVKAKVETYPWGREGEVALCVRLRTDADAEHLFHLIKKLFPDEPRGPLGVSTRSGLRFSAPRSNRPSES